MCAIYRARRGLDNGIIVSFSSSYVLFVEAGDIIMLERKEGRWNIILLPRLYILYTRGRMILHHTVSLNNLANFGQFFTRVHGRG
jgi:hypothetical protein